MRGLFRNGDYLLVAPVVFGSLRRGDVAAFDSGGRSISHRIVGRAAAGFITQGDANQYRDKACLGPEHLIGRVMALERQGKRLPVRGGMPGRLQGAILRFINQGRRFIFFLLAFPYRLISHSRMASLFWRPRIMTVHFSEGRETFTKYIHRGATVACWFPHERRWTCRKPYDLILGPPK